MFLGVVGRPIPHCCFDGKVLLERVSEDILVTKQTAHQNFSDDILINSAIKGGEWRRLFEGKLVLSADEIITTVSEFYDLDEVVSTRLEVSYTSFVGNSGNTKDIKLCGVTNVFEYYVQITRDKDLDKIPITVNDLKLKVRYCAGDYIIRDCSCDSSYMRLAMNRVGKVMREKYYWVKKETAIYLVIDNAGGHGTNDCVQEYTDRLRTEYNI